MPKDTGGEELFKKDGLLVVCCMCKKTKYINKEGKEIWKYIEKHLSLDNLTHSYCDDCYDKKITEIKERFNK